MFVIDCLISELIIKLTATPETTVALIRQLALVEYGIANHCRKLAGEIDPSLIPPDPNHTHQSDNPLAQFLWEQYIEERLHGQMLAALLQEPSPKNQGIGQCRYLQGWVGKYQVEGLSNISPFWWLLNGKSATDLEISDRVAMMSVLESYSYKFYQCLYFTLPECPLFRIADKISADEIEHAEGLHAILIGMVGKTKASWLLMKWHIKVLFILPEVVRLALAFAHNSNAEVKINA